MSKIEIHLDRLEKHYGKYDFYRLFNFTCIIRKNGICKTIKKENIEIIIFENLYDKNFKKYNLEDIYNLYNNYGENIYYLDVIYSLIIIDYKLNRLFIYQDFFGVTKIYISFIIKINYSFLIN